MAVSAPSGVTVARSGNNYNLTWKLGAKYTAQILKYRVGNKPWVTVSGIGKDTTSKTVTINKNSYYPLGDLDRNSSIQFSLVGKIGNSSSAAASAIFYISPPPTPEITVHPSDNVDNETTFSWRINWGNVNKDTGNQIFTKVDVYSVLTKDSEIETKEIVGWRSYPGYIEPDVESGDITITETVPLYEFYSYTRHIMIVAMGPGGDCYPAFAKRVYAIPNVPKNIKAEATVLAANTVSAESRFRSGYMVKVDFDIDVTLSRPVDELRIEYAIETPITAYADRNGNRYVDFTAPAINNWTTGSIIHDDSLNGYYYGSVFSRSDSYRNPYKHVATFVIDNDIPTDKWVFVRVVSKYKDKVSASQPVLVEMGDTLITERSKYGIFDEPHSRTVSLNTRNDRDLCGYLNDPSGLSANVNGNIATVSVNNNSSVEASCVAIYYRTDKNPKERIIGIKPANSSTALSIQLPEEQGDPLISLGAKTFLMDYGPSMPAITGVTEYTRYRVYNESYGIIWDDRPVPKPPTNIVCSSPRTGVVHITWDWSWIEANGVEISWANHEDAWESTDEPSRYSIENQRATSWNITGLNIGQWYFRIRLYKIDGDATTYGTYSRIVPFKLSSTPITPTLNVDPSAVAPDGKVNCYWSFTALEGDEQLKADICEATIHSDGTISYGPSMADTTTAQFITLDVKRLGWEAGSTHYLSVKITTTYGEKNNNWSVPKAVQVFDPIAASIDSTSLRTITVIDDADRGISHQQLSLTEMPLQVSASGAGDGGAMTYILERSGDYQLDRPDEDTFTGFNGETIAIVEKTSRSVNGVVSYSTSIKVSDLIGSLDDGAYYNLIAIAKDSNGQTSQSEPITFAVHWSHQAVMPSATIEVDNENLATFITPVRPQTGYATGDTCDIYRLSIDKPELIIGNASFNVKYVDPYPTLGDNGGHRIVYKTKNGDYITEDNEFAWMDYRAEDGDIIDKFATVIDFGDGRVILPYDLSLSSKWSKDFVQTKYLGGSIEGDWNPAVEKTISIRTRVAVKHDSALVESMRRLATYSGVCHVRTPDGSSFAANVDVGEDREEKNINMLASFTLDVTRVDAVGFDGVTYEDWIKED